MENFLEVARQVVQLFVLMGVGFACRRLKLLDDAAVKGIVNVLILVVTPCLMMTAFQRPFDPSLLASLGIAFAAAVAVHAASIALAALAFRGAADASRRVLRMAAVFSNAGFMGIPLEEAILGPKGVFFGAVYIVVFNVFMWSWGLALMRGSFRLNRTMFVNPGTIGLAFGLPLFVFSWRLPPVAGRPVEMMAALNTPLAMIVIGYYLAGAKLGRVFSSVQTYLASAARLVVVPLAVTLAFLPFRASLDREMMLSAVIPAAAPVAAMVTMFASRYDRDVDLSVGLVTGTTLVSIVTMPVVIAIALHLLQVR